MSNPFVVAFARALMQGDQTLDACTARAAVVAGKPFKWVRVVASAYLARPAAAGPPRERETIRFLLADGPAAFLARARRAGALRSVWLGDPPPMRPVDATRTWTVPAIRSTGALASWLGTSVERLLWLADPRGMVTQAPGTRLHHYSYRVVPKRRGGVRIIESPKADLKAMQRRILAGILELAPPWYEAAHGFVKGRSIRTFAAPHVGKAAVLRLDLQEFFPTIGRARVSALFRTMGYPETVAGVLAALCTNVTPRRVLCDQALPALSVTERFAVRARYRVPHLPQGAPTSPAIANLCAYRLDSRLTGLADWAGATYTRYADDLAFSGDEAFARAAGRYAIEASAIVRDEGWQVEHRKTRIMRRGVRQRLAGLTVNRTLNVDRRQYDSLKATLTNCIRHGPASQNRDGRADYRAHLEGLVSFVASVHPARGERLRGLLARVDWSSPLSPSERPSDSSLPEPTA